MPRKRSKQPTEPEPRLSDLVPVIFAADKAEAAFYKTLLADADIRAVIGTEADDLAANHIGGIAVLVQAELLDDATEIITAREEMEEHILAAPEERDAENNDEEDNLSGVHRSDDTDEEGEVFFRPDHLVEDDAQ